VFEVQGLLRLWLRGEAPRENERLAKVDRQTFSAVSVDPASATDRTTVTATPPNDRCSGDQGCAYPDDDQRQTRFIRRPTPCVVIDGMRRCATPSSPEARRQQLSGPMVLSHARTARIRWRSGFTRGTAPDGGVRIG